MSRSRVDLPQPDGPISETNSPGRIARSMPSSALVRPAGRLEDLVDAGDRRRPARCAVRARSSRPWPSQPVAAAGRPRSADQLGDPDRRGRTPGRAARRRGSRPTASPGALRVLLVEVEDRAPEPELAAARVPLADDRADDARRRGDLERREQVRQRGGHPELPEDRPARGGAAAHQLERPRVGRGQAADLRRSSPGRRSGTRRRSRCPTRPLPNAKAISGARARIGIVWLATT